jgi:hypothetical protein
MFMNITSWIHFTYICEACCVFLREQKWINIENSFALRKGKGTLPIYFQLLNSSCNAQAENVGQKDVSWTTLNFIWIYRLLILLSLPIPPLFLSHAFGATLRGFQYFNLSREIRDTKIIFLSKRLTTADSWFIIHYKYYVWIFNIFSLSDKIYLFFIVLSFCLFLMWTYVLYIANFRVSHTTITRYKLLKIYLCPEILPIPSKKQGWV